MRRMNNRAGTGRRGFLKSVAAGAAQIGARPDRTAAAAQGAAAASGIQYPRTFSGRQLAMISFPLGGVAAGSVGLGGRGQLREWEVFNRADKGRSINYAFPSIWAQA